MSSSTGSRSAASPAHRSTTSPPRPGSSLPAPYQHSARSTEIIRDVLLPVLREVVSQFEATLRQGLDARGVVERIRLAADNASRYASGTVSLWNRLYEKADPEELRKVGLCRCVAWSCGNGRAPTVATRARSGPRQPDGRDPSDTRP